MDINNIIGRRVEKWLFTLCMVAFMPLSAQAINIKLKKDKTIVDDICYQLNAKKETATVVKKAEPYLGDVVIPESVEVDSLTFFVEEIAAGAFEKSSGMTSIVIPKGVSKIGARAFAECSSLTAIELPKGIIELPAQLFADCA
ncbi:MAG: leucine-rich repeat protein, partial [Prevotella sp.]|nr:leucine-rich repeat protein [Prevotella sp.]